MSTKHVVIAGGGLIGCAIAWKLAARGVRVHVIEAARPGMAASWAAAGMLAPLFEGPNEAFRRLARSSVERYPEFVRDLYGASGIDADLQMSGKLDLAFSTAEYASLREHYGTTLPASVHELAANAARELEPGISADTAGALVSDNDGSVDNRKLARAAWIAATSRGAEFTIGSSVREVLCSRNGFEALYLSTGERIEADAVVVAAGAWSSSIRGLPQPLPVYPVRGQMIALEAIPPVLSRIVLTRDCYIVPRADGRVLVGSTIERAGFEARTTAAGIAHLLNASVRAVPKLAQAAVVETWAGLRPGTADELPILGEDPRAPGVFYATGHFRNGILLAPITADLTAAALCGDAAELDLRPFSAGRFHG
ncbi:MAG: glycine oxidase ThiO [Gemmatimonadota bacterium]